MIELKKCPKCDEEYPLTEEFWTLKTIIRSDGTEKQTANPGYCRTCVREYQKEYQRKRYKHLSVPGQLKEHLIKLDELRTHGRTPAMEEWTIEVILNLLYQMYDVPRRSTRPDPHTYQFDPDDPITALQNPKRNGPDPEAD